MIESKLIGRGSNDSEGRVTDGKDALQKPRAKDLYGVLIVLLVVAMVGVALWQAVAQ